MKILVDKRQTGRTTKLIKKCAKTGGYIVCCSRNEAHRIFALAHKMRKNIPLPLTFDEFLKCRYYPPGVRKLYIDNVEMLLRRLAPGVEIEAITLTKEEKKEPKCVERREGEEEKN